MALPEPRRLFRTVRHHHDRSAIGETFAQYCLDALCGALVERTGRFVQQQHWRGQRERSDQCEPLTFAGGKPHHHAIEQARCEQQARRQLKFLNYAPIVFVSAATGKNVPQLYTTLDLVAKERAIYEAQVKDKPANVTAKIVEGKLDKFYSTICLLEQGFIKNPDQTINDLVKSKIAELGENIVIRRFTRYQVGEVLGDAPAKAAE